MTKRAVPKSSANQAADPGLRLDKTAFAVGSVTGESDEKAYWLSKTPQERLQAVEVMRQINYGYDPVADRLQRVLEIAELKVSQDGVVEVDIDTGEDHEQK